ncbi:MAG: hypothetical protein AAB391_03135 [Patescibacteria group bacterium]
MKTNTRSVRSFLPLLVAGLSLLLGVGCAGLRQERFYSLTQAADGKFYDPTGEQRFPSAATVRVENTLEKGTIEVFVREDKNVVLIPPKSFRTVHVQLDYYQQGYVAVLFARILDDNTPGRTLAKRAFIFQNARHNDRVYGQDFGPVIPETKVWIVKREEFILPPPQPPAQVRSSGFGLGWFR